MDESWRPVTGFETRYEVSNKGRVRSLDFAWGNPLTGGLSKHKGKLLTPVDSGKGYLRVYIVGKRVSVHRLVCEAFHGTQPPEKPYVLHGDGNPQNNYANNLRWGTQVENELDKKLHGRNHEANKTHCPQNHEYTEKNTRISKTGYRVCRECARIRNQEKRNAGLPEGDPKHGTNEGYLGYKCRCEPCKKAGAAYSRARKLRRVA